MTTYSTPDVAAKVRGIAAEKRVTQAELADALNVSRMAITRRFNGSVDYTATELVTLGRFLHVPVAAFFGEYAWPSPVDPDPSPTGSAGVALSAVSSSRESRGAAGTSRRAS